MHLFIICLLNAATFMYLFQGKIQTEAILCIMFMCFLGSFVYCPCLAPDKSQDIFLYVLLCFVTYKMYFYPLSFHLSDIMILK
jgi:hypothetical protein